jgi:hypothetical protein
MANFELAQKHTLWSTYFPFASFIVPLNFKILVLTQNFILFIFSLRVWEIKENVVEKWLKKEKVISGVNDFYLMRWVLLRCF